MQSAVVIVALELCLSASINAGASDSAPSSVQVSSALTPKVPVAPPAATLVPSSFEARLHNAETVKVVTSVLGVELGIPLESAHQKLDALSDPATPPTEGPQDEEEREGERKVLWRFSATDYSALLLKTGDDGRITSINASVRPGKEQAFEALGEVSKAPICSPSEVAWDVVRPDLPLIRVVARGEGGKANSILLFIVKRGSHGD